jgi:tetratricopeptide (TPR) repeat protein
MTATSILDDRTTNAVRQALGAASQGRLAEACQIGESALAGGGDIIALNAMLGMFRCQSGQTDVGIGHLQIAHKARPGDAKIASNLANALASAGRYQEALDVLTAELAKSDKSRQLL